MTTPRRRLSAELALVSRLAAVDTADGARPLGLLDAPSSLDWSRVQRLAAYHAVTPAVQQWVAAAGPLASATAAAMLQDRMLGATANLAKFVRWRGLNAKFADANLKVVTIRGFATALGVYGDLERRVVGDLDLLVSPNEVLPTLAVLARDGYYLTALWQQALIKRGLPKILAESSQMTLGGPDGLSVDLHWRASTRRDGLGTEALLRAAVRRDCDGGTYWALPAAYALAQLLDGSERSHRSRLRWLVDVDTAVNRLTVDEATQLRRLLEGSGRLVALAEALVLIEALWGCHAAAERFGALPTPRDRQIAQILHALEVRTKGSLLALLRRGLRVARRAVRGGDVGRGSATDPRPASSPVPGRSSRPPITLVTAVYDSSPQPMVGGRGRDIHSYLPSLIDLARLEAALVLFCPAKDVETITTLLAPHFAELSVRPFELRSFPHFDLLMRRQAEHRDRSQDNERNPALGFLKLQWLATVSAESPFGHRHSYWVDAGLTQHRLFPEGSLTPRLGHAIVAATPANRMFIGATPHRDDNPAYRGVVAALRSVPFEQATIEHRLVSSLFGGRREPIAAVKHRFDPLAHALLRHRIYAPEDQVLSILNAAEPELFALRHVEASQVDAV